MYIRPKGPTPMNWWTALGFEKNPYVYGPMPWKRTSQYWRRVEARNTKMIAWRWNDDPELVSQRTSGVK